MKLTRGCRRMLRQMLHGYRLVVEHVEREGGAVRQRVYLYDPRGDHRMSRMCVVGRLREGGLIGKAYGLGGCQAYYRLTESGEQRARRMRIRRTQRDLVA